MSEAPTPAEAPPETVALLGLGLVGGMLGLALRAAGHDVVGYDLDANAIAEARDHGAIARGAESAGEAVRSARTVIVATPILAIEGVFRAIAPELAPGTLVTDVASTKRGILAAAQRWLPAHAPFVGGHPMAGSEKTGVRHATARMLQGAPYAVITGPEVAEAALQRLEALILAMGARPLRLDAELHDRSVAAISHVPFLIACALVESCALGDDWATSATLAATGFRDMSRLASDNVTMHRDICLSNAHAIAPRLRDVAARLEGLAGHLEDPAFLETYFPPIKAARDAWFTRFEGHQP